MTRTFKLYPEERHWWSMNDYGAVIDVMNRLKPARVLEFGPGSSTLALIEGGAAHVDTLEDSVDWAEVYEKRLQGKYPDIVRVHRYVWSDPLTTPVDGERYDLALVDGPLGTDRRPDAVLYAMARSRAVLVPTETKNPRVLEALRHIAAETGADLEVWETGPLSGGFALMTPKPKSEQTPEPELEPADAALGEHADKAPAIMPDEREAPIPTVEAVPPPKLTRRERRKLSKAEPPT